MSILKPKYSSEHNRKELYSNNNIVAKLQKQAGVYVLVFDQEVDRLHGTDSNDKIAYIGSAGNSNSLLVRLRHFYNCAQNLKNNSSNEPVEGHSAGQMYLRYLKKIYGDVEKTLKFRFETLATEIDAKDEEARLLKEYLTKYGELPPLNNQLPRR